VGNDIIAILLLSIVIARLSSFLLGKLRVPPIAAYMIVGILLGPSVLKLITVNDYPDILVTFSLLFLLFYAGLNVDFRGFRIYFKQALILTISGVSLTSIITLLILAYLGYSLYASLIVAISLSNTATEVVVIMLEQTGGIDDIFKRTLISASFFDDILAVMLMSIVKGGMLGSGSTALIEIMKFTASFAAIAALSLLIAKVLQRRIYTLVINWSYLVMLASILFFGFSYTFGLLGLGMTLGAYLAGLLISSLRLTHDPTLMYVVRIEELITRIGTILEFFIIPIFFVYVGIKVNIHLLFTPLTLILLTLAFIGKFVGSLIPTYFSSGARKAVLMGIAMNVRGSLEPALALLALEVGVISLELFNSVIMVSLITSLIIPVLFSNLRGRLSY